MLKIFVFVFSAISFLCAHAQSGINRCEIKRIEETDKFEHWLSSSRIKSAVQSATIYRIPVVVHVLHNGDALGEGFNFPASRIVSQIRTLNEDYRRKANTPGFNSHPDGGDTQIEFVLAQIDPDGNHTDRIDRIDMNVVHPTPAEPGTGDIISLFARYTYWDPEQYLNIWCVDSGFPPGLFLGSARFPVSDLPGLDTQSPEGDGVFINALNFGRGEINNTPNYDQGRTLTHEMGHFLGVLHTFGSVNECGKYTDYCEDTPPVSSSGNGCPAVKPLACDGREAMIENYMDYSYDRCMNIFTNNQIARMHTVLENSPRRKSLLTSPVIDRRKIITDIPESGNLSVKIYPNPATDKLYISVDEKFRDSDIKLTAHTLLGKMIFEKNFKMTETAVEIPVSELHEKMIVVTIERPQLYYKQLVVIN